VPIHVSACSPSIKAQARVAAKAGEPQLARRKLTFFALSLGYKYQYASASLLFFLDFTSLE
jgi:hypothetical protein